MGKIIGIDLGTTYSAVAVVNQYGKAEILPNREGERITPSVVLFDGEAPIVGSIAKRSAAASPENVVQFVKRQMGNASFKFRTENGTAYTPEEISALILKRLKEDAETLLGEMVTDAVITVPAYFNDAQRKATQDAGKIAGLNVRRIINEPTAAALAYGIEKSGKEETILVYDLGGGTFDVTIMRVGPGEIEVIATDGDKNLGGFDWDNELMAFLNEAFKKQGGPDLLDDPALEQDLRDKVEMAKKTLSVRDKATVILSGGGKNVSVPLSLQAFNDLTSTLVQRTARIMEMVLEDAQFNWSDIDKILLVGGSTRMKAVPAMVERVTGKKPSLELHPDEVVALGAALQGAVLQAQAGEGSEEVQARYSIVEITDVCSHGMGVIALNENDREFNSIILEKNKAIPCKASNVYRTVTENQTELHVRVTEGESEEADRILGETTLRIPPYPKGAPIDVLFEYDADGVVHVYVKDLTAGRFVGECHIKRPNSQTEQEVERMSLKVAKVVVG